VEQEENHEKHLRRLWARNQMRNIGMKIIVFTCLSLACSAFSQTSYAFVNFAGQPGGTGNANGTGIGARFNYPAGVAVDASGNVYVADTINSTIRRITLAGVVTTIAGSPGQTGSANGTNGTALFYAPTGIAVDHALNLYVADYGNSTIRKITPVGTNWVVATLAGSAGQTGSANGTGTAATFSDPQGIAVDGSGNVYVGDTANDLIRKITPSGVVTTLAGSAGVGGYANGIGTTATFNNPCGLAVDDFGNVYVADSGNNVIRKITPGGEVSTYASGFNVPSGVAVNVDASLFYVADSGNNRITGSFTVGGLHYPMGVALDREGNVYAADTYNQMIRKITPAGLLTTLAGSMAQAGSADGSGNLLARFQFPEGLAVDVASNVYVADTYNQTIRKISPNGWVTTIAGRAGQTGSANGLPEFSIPLGVAVDNAGNVYVADYGNEEVRKITPAGGVSTLAELPSQPNGLAIDSMGNLYVGLINGAVYEISTNGALTYLFVENGGGAVNGVAVDTNENVYAVVGSASLIDKYSPVTGIDTTWVSENGLSSPIGIAFDSIGNMYVTGNDTVQMITPTGTAVTTIAGSAGSSGSVDGTNSAARFHSPTDVALDSAGNVYVVDSGNDTIRKVTLVGTNWVVTTIAGSAGNSGSANGTNSFASFDGPQFITVDNASNLYVTDGSETVRKIMPVGTNWVVTTIAGVVGQSGNLAGEFSYPAAVAVDNVSNVYVADTDNQTIRKITTTGAVTTIAGSPGQVGSANGTGSAASFYYPSGVTVDSAGNVYVADTYNHTIRKITTEGVVTTLAGSAGYYGSADGTGSSASFWAPNGVAVDGSGNVYVADTFNNTIRFITPAGVVTTIAGTAGQVGSADGTGSAAQFDQPTGLTVDSMGNIYVADNYNQTIRRITPTVISGSTNWIVTTVGGTPGVIGGGFVDGIDGVGPAAEFDFPMGVAVDSAGNVYVADTGNNRISMDSIFQNVVLGPTFGTSSITGGLFQVSVFNPSPGLPVIVQASSNLSTWVPILTNSAAVFEVSQGVTNQQSQLFFRAYIVEP
jgi:sugar lactone lactonase YvrE